MHRNYFNINPNVLNKAIDVVAAEMVSEREKQIQEQINDLREQGFDDEYIMAVMMVENEKYHSKSTQNQMMSNQNYGLVPANSKTYQLVPRVFYPIYIVNKK